MNNISGEKKPEMITDRNGNVHFIGDSNIQAIKAVEESLQHNSVILVGNVRAGKTALMKEAFENSMRLKSEKIKDLLEPSLFNKHVVELHGITDLKFNNEDVEIIKPFNHKYKGLLDIYPDEKIWLQTISTDKSH